MVVEGRSRRVTARNASRAVNKSTDFRNIITTLQLHPFVSNFKSASLISTCVITVIYVIVNLLLLGGFLFTALNYMWYTHLLFLVFLFLYVFGGGFVYYTYFEKNDFMMYAYIALMSFVYCPLFKWIYVLGIRLLPGEIVMYIFIFLELMISSYIVRINLMLYCEPLQTQRSYFIFSIIMGVVQLLGVIITYTPFRSIIVFPPKGIV